MKTIQFKFVTTFCFFLLLSKIKRMFEIIQTKYYEIVLYCYLIDKKEYKIKRKKKNNFYVKALAFKIKKKKD